MYHIDDTIAAIASAPGGAARGIVRISGPQVVPILESCFRPLDAVALATLRQATVLPGMLALAQSPVDQLHADLLLWPDGRSYTRETCAELHTIGSPPLLAEVLSTLCQAGARLAEPGEFTLRAFLAGRLDLAQAEAVLGVIDARGADQLQTALQQLAGGLSGPLGRLRETLLDLLAQIEAGLDFAEEDLQFIGPEEIARRLDDAAALVERTRRQLTDRGRPDSLPRAVLVGRPNTGKSSLFNALVPQAAALVSNRPGTTRDYLTATLELDGVECLLVDTAGVETLVADEGGIGHAAGQLAAEQAHAGDVRLVCLDATRPPSEDELELLAANPGEPQLVLLTKCDQPRQASFSGKAIETSAHTGLGLNAVRQGLRQALLELARNETASHMTADRCGDSLRVAGQSLARAAELNRSRAGDELIGSELRVALAELSSVVGAVYTDDVLERIFSHFCIGK